MVIESRFSAPIPSGSIQKWILGNCSEPLPDRKAWIDADEPSRYLTLSAARLLAKRLAKGLIEYGLKPGERVLVFSGNTVVFPVMILGIWMAQGVYTGANPSYVPRELAHQLEDSGSRIMLACSERLDTALRAAEMAGMRREDVFAFDGKLLGSHHQRLDISEGLLHWSSLLATEEEGRTFVWKEPNDSRETTCTLNYSSGTTGLPKGVEITHYNHVANGQGVVSMAKLHPQYEEQTRRGAALCFLPMYHAFSQGYFVTCFPHEGIPVYVMPQFDFAKMLNHISNFRITRLYVVPPILMLMSRHPLAKSADLSSLEMVGSGAAPLSVNIQKQANQVLDPGSGGKLRQGWGMTELTCTALAWDPSTSPADGVGELMPGSKAKLVDIVSGEEVTQPDVLGELYISAPTVMRGYWRNEEATRSTITIDNEGNRWLQTGDIAYVTPSYGPGARFHIVDRLKELVKVRGFQVSPTELEQLLLQKEDIQDSAVIGVMKDGEEAPRAYVVCKADAPNVSGKEVEDWVAGRVAPYKRLKGGVIFVDAIPRNPSGKILRKVLVERATRELDEIHARL